MTTKLEELKSEENALQVRLLEVRTQIEKEKQSPEAKVRRIIEGEGYTITKLSSNFGNGFFIEITSTWPDRDLTTITGRIYDATKLRLDGVRQDSKNSYRTWWETAN